MDQQGRARALIAAALVVAMPLGGCVFVPPAGDVADAEPIAAPAAPDPDAPRLPRLDTRIQSIAAEGVDVIGAPQVMFTRYENTFSAIAIAYDLGYEEMRRANPGVDHWLPGEGTPVYLPTQKILPDAPREGIVVNVASMRLMYFEPEPAAEGEPARLLVASYPIGIGREGWSTPLGKTEITGKVVEPTWYPPASIRAEHAAAGDPLPSVVPPGPDNPLGPLAMTLSIPSYLIHGTNKPAGVGMRSSHGCIRMYNDDVAWLFERVRRGTPVHIVNQPVLAGWRDGELYLEVNRPLEEDDVDLAAEAERVLAEALARDGAPQVTLDRDAIATIVAEQRGIALPVSRPGVSPAQYLASARVIENTVPLPEREQTASAE